ncbi:hypothetical protein [Campylobacter troglodytis]|uniref:hypothetical protein n=1 Tax=Campylobacter troglodytis TaxID=654363 RepID=UPI00115796DC|nr:hypothetical protein [Campylobacter troglodytis]
MNSKHFPTSNTNEVCHFKPCQPCHTKHCNPAGFEAVAETKIFLDPCHSEHCEEARNSTCHTERVLVSHNSKRASSFAKQTRNDKRAKNSQNATTCHSERVLVSRNFTCHTNCVLVSQAPICHNETSCEVSRNSKRAYLIASLPRSDKKLNRDISFSTKTRNDKNSNIDPSSFAKPQYDKGKKSLCRVSKNSHDKSPSLASEDSHDKSPSLASEDSHDKSFCRADGQHIKPPSLAEGGLGGGYENLENSQSTQNSTNAFNSCYTETSCEVSHNSKRTSSIASLPRSDKKLNRDISFSTKTRNDKNSKNIDPSSFSKPQHNSVKKSTKSKEFK